MMKGRIFISGLFLALLVAACSTKVELYSYDGDTTIVYAILDPNADTNFFKITKSFLGNVNELGYNYEANNYNYDEIDVKLIGCFGNSNNTDTIPLDTISKLIPYNENSMFYSGIRQVYYFTDQKLRRNHEYQLLVLRHTDNITVSAKIKTPNDVVLRKPFIHKDISFRGKNDSVVWVVNDPSMNNHSNASYFDINGYFHYKELMPGATDTVEQVITWNMSSGEPSTMYSSYGYYLAYYTPRALFDILGTNNYLIANSPYGVKRWVEKFEFCISSIGDELYIYHIINNSSSLIMEVPNYSNIENGIGLMSSSANTRSFHTIDQITRKHIADDFNYGFIYEPND